MWTVMAPHAARLFAQALFAAFLLNIATMRHARAMEVTAWGDQLVLFGRVVDGDTAKVEAALAQSPQVTTIILRDSPGGDIKPGYRLGEEFRAKGLRTAVSGFCNSSCSVMFLGGKVRVFTNDAPRDATYVGFHGHYNGRGRLIPGAVKHHGLKDWIIRYSDGKADSALVERWINIPVNVGLIRFFNPTLVRRHGASTFMCQGMNPPGKTVFDCEPVAKTALDLGVVTSLHVISSHDIVAARAAMPRSLMPTGYAEVGEIDKVALKVRQGVDEYLRFMAARPPRAFAIAADHLHWAWDAGIPTAPLVALARCAARTRKPCRLYAVDDSVVWSSR